MGEGGVSGTCAPRACPDGAHPKGGPAQSASGGRTCTKAGTRKWASVVVRPVLAGIGIAGEPSLETLRWFEPLRDAEAMWVFSLRHFMTRIETQAVMKAGVPVLR
jgi:hypothetical protein